MIANQKIEAAKRIIIKVGSALLINAESGDLKRSWLESLAEDIAALKKTGKDVILVTSGSVALGRKYLGISQKISPSSIPLEQKQASAAIGQIALMQAYFSAFQHHGIVVGQVLLTLHDTEDRRSHLNARATLNRLLQQGIIPVINENDTVSTADRKFGDNDRLAARVAQMMEADLLIQLSTTNGLYTADPTIDPSAQHVPVVKSLDADVLAMAGDAVAGVSTGGMKSKLEAARLATSSGTCMIIAKGTDHHPLSLLQKGAVSTVFEAQEKPGTARKRWIATHIKPAGTITIDEGALKALQSGRSLLPAGIKSVEGEFVRGDAVTVLDMAGKAIAIGLAAYGYEDAKQIIGKKTADISAILGYFWGEEIIHRDDLALV